MLKEGFSGSPMVMNLPANARDVGLISGAGRNPGEGNGKPLLYSCLVHFMDRGAWRAMVHKVTKNWTATAKLRQSCPTLCDPIDGSPPGSPIPGIL